MTTKLSSLALNKFLAYSGLCSRRKADVLIKGKKILVDGTPVITPNFKVEPHMKVMYDGRIIKLEQKVYVLLNKPKGYISTVSDERQRKTVLDLVQDAGAFRMYPIGRLDRATTGLIILTNDGELTQRLSHPRNEIKKTYVVTLADPLSFNDLKKIEQGLHLEDGIIKVDSISYIEHNHQLIRVELHSGRNRIIRRIFEHLGHAIAKLDRTNFAGLSKKHLPQGKWRYLTLKEIDQLRDLGTTKSK